MSGLRDALLDLPDAVFADLLESDDAYLLVIDLPGATKETVDARVTGNRLRVEAQREKDIPPEFRYLEENRSLFIDAEFPLPLDVTGSAEASIRQGVLELRLPKTTSDAGEPIPVTDG